MDTNKVSKLHSHLRDGYECKVLNCFKNGNFGTRKWQITKITEDALLEVLRQTLPQ